MSLGTLTSNVGETFHGLNEDADAQRQEEDAIEEGAEQGCSLPAKGIRLWCWLGPFRNLVFH